MPEDAAWYARRWLPLTAQFYDALIEQLWLTPGDRLLDIACGPGALVAEVAPIVGPFGRAIGFDRSAEMLSAARRLARRHSLHNTAFVGGDLRALPFAAGSFDAITCAFGFPGGLNPVTALTAMHALLRPGGHLGVIVGGAADRSPGAGLLVSLMAKRGLASAHEAGFEADSPAVPERWLSEAGCKRPGALTLTRDLRRLDFEDFWADVLAGRMPGTPLYRALPAQTQAALRVEVQDRLADYRSGTRLALPVEAVIAWGTA